VLAILDSRDILKITKEGISILLVSARGDNVAMVYSAKSKNAELNNGAVFSTRELSSYYS